MRLALPGRPRDTHGESPLIGTLPDLKDYVAVIEFEPVLGMKAVIHFWTFLDIGLQDWRGFGRFWGVLGRSLGGLRSSEYQGMGRDTPTPLLPPTPHKKGLWLIGEEKEPFWKGASQGTHAGVGRAGSFPDPLLGL